MAADGGIFPRLINLIPEGVVREMADTGHSVTATEAKHWACSTVSIQIKAPCRGDGDCQQGASSSIRL